MSAELRVSASAFTHRGQLHDVNTGNFILDGRYLFGFELDNSHISLNNWDRSYFFAICDSRRNDYLNTSVSGIKELKKLSGRLKTYTGDIKSKTEMMGECFINTENLLYESVRYADFERNRPTRDKTLTSLDKKLMPDGEKRTNAKSSVDDEGDIGEDLGDEYDDNFDGSHKSGYKGEFRDEYKSEYRDEPKAEPEDGYKSESRDKPEDGIKTDDYKDGYEDDYDDGYEDGYNKTGGHYTYPDDEYYDEDEDDFEDDFDFDDDDDDRYSSIDTSVPGGKGFSTAGIVISDKKISVLAQGDCEAFLLRGSTLRILSSSENAVGGSDQRMQNVNARMRQNSGPYHPYGRSSEVFDAKEGDVLLLCCTDLVDALGKDNIDDYLAMREDASIITSTMMFDAVKSEPDRNLTCLVVKIEEIQEEDMLASVQKRMDARYSQSGVRMGSQTGAGTGVGAAVSGMNTGAGGVAKFETGSTRIANTPYQNRDAFSKTAAQKFEAPSKKFGPKSFNKSFIQSAVTTVVLIVLLLVSYYLFEENKNGSSGVVNNSRTTTTTTAGTRTTGDGGNMEGVGDDGGGGYENGDEPTTHDQDSGTTTRYVEPTPTPTPGPLAMHKVSGGENLGRIAQRYYGSSAKEYVDLIKEANNLTSDLIRVNDELTIPQKPATEASPSPSPAPN
ncbi:MAG: LysM peptidoglycan-binding domain-containing protein [Synergistaceae bacterium]|nr:LysM peptidoglycan-binding domain-containing protein [Synergistaceae bacterium]